MKVEYSESEQKPRKKKRKKRSKLKRIIFAFFSILLVLAVAVGLMLTVFFNISSVRVVGSSIYSSEDIIYASGIMQGDNLLRLPSDEIEARIEKALPFIAKAEIIKSFPDTVGIKVTPAEESMLLITEKGSFTTDSSFKLLRQTTDTESSLLRIRGIKAESYTLGTRIEFSDNQQRDVLRDVSNICKEKNFSIDYIDVESVVDIKFVMNNNKLLVKLGSYSDLSGKINHLEATLGTIDKDVSAIITLSEWSLSNKEAVLKYTDISELIK